MTWRLRRDGARHRRNVGGIWAASLVAVAVICWLALARVLGSDSRFIVLSALAWALFGTVLTLIAIRGGRGETVGEVVESEQARRVDPEVGDGTPSVPLQRGLEAELERLRCRNRVRLDVREDGLYRISCATAMRVGTVEDLERILSSLPTGAGWRSVWDALFDYPELSDDSRARDR